MHDARPRHVGSKGMDGAGVSRDDLFANIGSKRVVGTCAGPASAFAIKHMASSSGFLDGKIVNKLGQTIEVENVQCCSGAPRLQKLPRRLIP